MSHVLSSDIASSGSCSIISGSSDLLWVHISWRHCGVMLPVRWACSSILGRSLVKAAFTSDAMSARYIWGWDEDMYCNHWRCYVRWRRSGDWRHKTLVGAKDSPGCWVSLDCRPLIRCFPQVMKFWKRAYLHLRSHDRKTPIDYVKQLLKHRTLYNISDSPCKPSCLFLASVLFWQFGNLAGSSWQLYAREVQGRPPAFWGPILPNTSYDIDPKIFHPSTYRIKDEIKLVWE